MTVHEPNEESLAELILKVREKECMVDDAYKNILSYTVLPVFIRIVLAVAVAVSAMSVIVVLFGEGKRIFDVPIAHFAVVSFIFISIIEIQVVLDKVIERFLPIPYKIRLRVFIQFVSGFILFVFAIVFINNFINPNLISNNHRSESIVGFLFGIMFINAMVHSITIIRFTEKWMQSQRQIDIMKQEQLIMNYNSLQDQLNPHYLFNNLSVLRALIHADPHAASVFTENFADVYRYVLKSRDKSLVCLDEELEFIKSYLDLHKARLKEGLSVSMEIDPDDLNKQIPPLTLQMLVENAIKHNVATQKQPLMLHVFSAHGCIEVRNQLRKKETTYSTKMGLKNLMTRYEFLSKKRVEVLETLDAFAVRIPLI